MLLRAGNVSCPAGKASKYEEREVTFLDSRVTHCLGGGMPAEGGGSAEGGLAEAKEVGVEAWMTCCCLAVGVSMEEAWVG